MRKPFIVFLACLTSLALIACEGESGPDQITCICDLNAGICDVGCKCDPVCAACTCDSVDGSCQIGCDCDPDCETCPCNTTKGSCQTDCMDCDPDCYCECNLIAGTCEPTCYCDSQDCDSGCTCNTSAGSCQDDCPCDADCAICDCDNTIGECDTACNCDTYCTAGSTPYAFCIDLWKAECIRAFSDCWPELAVIVEEYGTLESCVADAGARLGCVPEVDTQFDYDPANGTACLSEVYLGHCSMFAWPLPQSCADAITRKPVECLPIMPGTISGELTTTDQIFWNAYLDAYCLTLSAGDTITIISAPGTTGTPVARTSVGLLDSSETTLGWDYGHNPDNSDHSRFKYIITESGNYKAYVNGFDLTDVGTYVLTVEVCSCNAIDDTCEPGCECDPDCDECACNILDDTCDSGCECDWDCI